MAKLVSKTYGEALFEVAMESGEGKAVELAEEIRVIRDILAQNPQFDGLMNIRPYQSRISFRWCGTCLRDG